MDDDGVDDGVGGVDGVDILDSIIIGILGGHLQDGIGIDEDDERRRLEERRLRDQLMRTAGVREAILAMLGPNVATAMGGCHGTAAKMQADLAAHSTQATHRRAPTGGLPPGGGVDLPPHGGGAPGGVAAAAGLAGAMGMGLPTRGTATATPGMGGYDRPPGSGGQLARGLSGRVPPSYEPLAHDLPTPPPAASSTTPLPGGAPALGFVRQLRQSLRAPPARPGGHPAHPAAPGPVCHGPGTQIKRPGAAARTGQRTLVLCISIALPNRQRGLVRGGILPTSTPAPSAPSYSGPTGYQSDPVLAMLCGYQSDPAGANVPHPSISSRLGPSPLPSAGPALPASRSTSSLGARMALETSRSGGSGGFGLRDAGASLGPAGRSGGGGGGSARPFRVLSTRASRGSVGGGASLGVAGAADDGAGYSGTLLHRDLAGSLASVGVVGLGAPQPGRSPSPVASRPIASEPRHRDPEQWSCRRASKTEGLASISPRTTPTSPPSPCRSESLRSLSAPGPPPLDYQNALVVIAFLVPAAEERWTDLFRIYIYPAQETSMHSLASDSLERSFQEFKQVTELA
ncbi:hypothetical protein PAPYR_10621 [Paratrimastix pyriformis]|uniref:Uncharacterized protein n=1 Tax=Paratrimastix pyriformis TaxID=342808 RepID=A0ABQ8UAG8_9EUKA|nr:hypothetical protein PAPYR_10621 [Paratrimastix pyriformis]